MNQPKYEKGTPKFVKDYLQPFREAVADTHYNLEKLMYCYHRFYGKQHMLHTMLYLFVKLIYTVSHLRTQLRKISPLGLQIQSSLAEATESVVKFVSIEFKIFEEQQKHLSERLCSDQESVLGYLGQNTFNEFLSSKDAEILSGAVAWINKTMEKSDGIVKKVDEHRHPSCGYINDYIAKNPLYQLLGDILAVIDPLINMVVVDNYISTTETYDLSNIPENVRSATEGLVKIKQILDHRAIKYIQRRLWLYFFLLGLTWSGLAILTWVLGWNTMEPWTYFIGGTLTLGSYLYFVVTKRELSPRHIYEQLVQAKCRDNYLEFGFDPEKINTLITQTGITNSKTA